MARCDTTRARSSIILTLRNRHAVTHENSRKRALRDITLRNINRYQNHDVKPQLFDIFCIVVAKQSNDHIKKSRAREKKKKSGRNADANAFDGDARMTRVSRGITNLTDGKMDWFIRSFSNGAKFLLRNDAFIRNMLACFSRITNP